MNKLVIQYETVINMTNYTEKKYDVIDSAKSTKSARDAFNSLFGDA